jgi:siroheme synthase
MGAGQATSIARELVAAGMSPLLPVAIVENASLPDVRVIYTTLAALPTIANAGVAGPALIFIGAQFHARAAAAPQVGVSIARAPARRRG